MLQGRTVRALVLQRTMITFEHRDEQGQGQERVRAQPEQRDMINSLAIWLDGFLPWAQVAASLGRPVPDLVGFWAS